MSANHAMSRQTLSSFRVQNHLARIESARLFFSIPEPSARGLQLIKLTLRPAESFRVGNLWKFITTRAQLDNVFKEAPQHQFHG